MQHELAVNPACLVARAAGQKLSARTFIAAGTFTLKVFRPMRTRVCICIMLFAFCHVRIHAQALTPRLPPFIPGTQRQVDVAKRQPRHFPTRLRTHRCTEATPLRPPPTCPMHPRRHRQDSNCGSIPSPPTGVPVTIRALQQEKHGDTYHFAARSKSTMKTTSSSRTTPHITPYRELKLTAIFRSRAAGS